MDLSIYYIVLIYTSIYKMEIPVNQFWFNSNLVFN